MEENVQRIFSVLIAVMIFFILPLYMAFEKKDDISYSLALKITSNFVDNVQSKGYLSREMYDNFVSDLAVTGNIYDISIEHKAKKYVPTIYVYYNDEPEKIYLKLDYNTHKYRYKNYIRGDSDGKHVFDIDGTRFTKITLSYDLEEVTYNEKQILDILDSSETVNGEATYESFTKVLSSMSEIEYRNLDFSKIPSINNMYVLKDKPNDSIYTMSVGDEFNIKIKNTNTTIASVLFNSFTLGLNPNDNPKIYINYGATITNESYK